jgi:hypothetical protein
MAQASADDLTRVEVQRKVRPRIATSHPAIDFFSVGPQCGGHSAFGRGTIRPRGSRRNVAFAIEAFAKFGIGSGHMFVECVAAALFVASQVIAVRIVRLPGGCSSGLVLGTASVAP